MDIQAQFADFCHKHGLFPARHATVAELNRESGANVTDDEWAMNPTVCYRVWYDGLVRRYGSTSAPAAAASPRKPAPAIIAECWASQSFDADRAHEAMLALCRGN